MGPVFSGAHILWGRGVGKERRGVRRESMKILDVEMVSVRGISCGKSETSATIHGSFLFLT